MSIRNSANGSMIGWLTSNAPLVLYAGSSPASSLLISIFSARILGPTQFGAFAIVWATVQTFSAVGQLSLSFAATRFSAQMALSNPVGANAAIMKCFQWSLAGAVGVGFIMLLGAKPLAENMLGHADLRFALQLAALVAFFNISASVLSAGLIGLPSSMVVTLLGVTQLFLPILFGLFGVISFGVEGLLIGLAVAQAIRLAIGWLLLRQWRSTIPSGASVGAEFDSSAIFNFAAPNLIAGLVTPVVQWMALASVGAGPNGLHGIGLFSAANNVRNSVAIIYTTLFQIFTVRVNQAVGTARQQSASMLMRMNFGLSVGLCAVTALGLLVLGDKVFNVFGPEFVAAFSVLKFLLIAVVLDAASSVIYQYVVVSGSMWKSLLLIVLPRETCLLSVAVLSGAGGATEITLAAAHCVAAAIGLATTWYVARDGRAMIDQGKQHA